MKLKKAANVTGIIGGIFFMFGIIFAAVGIGVLCSNINFKKNAELITAVITDIDTYTERKADGERVTRHDVYISYTVDGVEYETELNEYNSGMRVGKEIEVYYAPDNPNKVKTDSVLFEAIFIGIGGVFAVIGSAFLISNINKAALRKRLIRDGEQLSGTIINVSRNYSVRINGVCPYKAECEVIDPYSGEKYLYSSDNYMTDICYMAGKTVTVYVDPNNRKKYYIDLESVSKDEFDEGIVHDYR